MGRRVGLFCVHLGNVVLHLTVRDLFGNRLYYGNTGPLSGVLDNLATLTTLSFPSLSVVMKGRRG